MKQSLKWHKECLKNQKVHVQKKQEELVKMQADYCRSYNSCEFYGYQVGQAEREGKDGFDEAKYLAKERESND